MDTLTIVVSVAALVVACAAAWYARSQTLEARRQAVAAEEAVRIERDRREEERSDRARADLAFATADVVMNIQRTFGLDSRPMLRVENRGPHEAARSWPSTSMPTTVSVLPTRLDGPSSAAANPFPAARYGPCRGTPASTSRVTFEWSSSGLMAAADGSTASSGCALDGVRWSMPPRSERDPRHPALRLRCAERNCTMPKPAADPRHIRKGERPGDLGDDGLVCTARARRF